MFDAQIHFESQSTADLDDVSDAVSWLLGALRMNGQICGKEWPIVRRDSGCAAYVLLPAEDALSPEHHSVYVRLIIAERLPQAGHYGARSRARELARLCPMCGGSWRLEEPWHIFDFKCDRCQLLSNIAWDVRG